jgi:hypothetical protein
MPEMWETAVLIGALWLGGALLLAVLIGNAAGLGGHRNHRRNR